MVEATTRLSGVEIEPAGGIGLREQVRIAVVGPLSGPRAAWGELLRSAARRHRSPGISWELLDDAGEIDLALRCAKEVVADGGYRAVVGHFNSFGAAAALPVYRDAGIPVLLPLSTGTGLLDGAGGVLRWCGTDDGQLVALAAAARRNGHDELLVTDDGSPYGRRLAADLLASGGARRLTTGTKGAVAVLGTHVGAAEAAGRLRDGGCRAELYFPDDCAVAEFAELVDQQDAFVARLAGGPAAIVDEVFTALTGAIAAVPAAAGDELLELLRAHAGLAFTAGGEPRWADERAGWDVVPLGDLSTSRMPTAARGVPELDSVVIGTGIVGSAAAAAIAAAGLRVAMIGLGPEGPSATRHSGGLVRAYDPDPRVRELAVRSFRLLWSRPEARDYGFRRIGSLVLLGGSDVDEAARGVAELRAEGLDVELLDREAVRTRWPEIAVPDVAGAVWEPGGGYTAPVGTANAYRAAALRLGVLGWQGRVNGVRPDREGVVVETSLGQVTARTAVVATGSGVPDLRNRLGAPVRPAARVKRIRYAYFDAGGRVLPIVADLVTGIWARPNLDGDSFLTGRPVQEWDAAAGGGEMLTPAQVEHIRAGVAGRFPWLAEAEYLGGRFGADLYGDGPLIDIVCHDLPIVAVGVFSGGGVKNAPAAADLSATTVAGML